MNITETLQPKQGKLWVGTPPSKEIKWRTRPRSTASQKKRHSASPRHQKWGNPVVKSSEDKTKLLGDMRHKTFFFTQLKKVQKNIIIWKQGAREGALVQIYPGHLFKLRFIFFNLAEKCTPRRWCWQKVAAFRRRLIVPVLPCSLDFVSLWERKKSRMKIVIRNLEGRSGKGWREGIRFRVIIESMNECESHAMAHAMP